MKRDPIMYQCDQCGRGVRAVAGDPIHVTSSGKFCAACLRLAAITETRAHAERVETTVATSSRRGDAARARWAAMTVDQRAERVAKMRSGREATP